MTSQTKVKPGAAATTTRGARPTSSTTRVVPSSNNGEGLPITVGSSHVKKKKICNNKRMFKTAIAVVFIQTCICLLKDAFFLEHKA